MYNQLVYLQGALFSAGDVAFGTFFEHRSHPKGALGLVPKEEMRGGGGGDERERERG